MQVPSQARTDALSKGDVWGHAQSSTHTHTPIPTPSGTHFKILAFSTPLAKNGATLPCVILKPQETKAAVMGVGQPPSGIGPMSIHPLPFHQRGKEGPQ